MTLCEKNRSRDLTDKLKFKLHVLVTHTLQLRYIYRTIVFFCSKEKILMLEVGFLKIPKNLSKVFFKVQTYVDGTFHDKYRRSCTHICTSCKNVPNKKKSSSSIIMLELLDDQSNNINTGRKNPIRINNCTLINFQVCTKTVHYYSLMIVFEQK